MKNENYKNIQFLEWARKVNVQHSDILDNMLKSTALLDRVIAKRIVQTAGGSEE